MSTTEKTQGRPVAAMAAPLPKVMGRSLWGQDPGQWRNGDGRREELRDGYTGSKL